MLQGVKREISLTRSVGMAVDGEIKAICDTYTKDLEDPDMRAANAMTDDSVRLAYEVHAMIDQQQQPYIKKFSKWWKQVRHHYAERRHDADT